MLISLLGVMLIVSGCIMDNGSESDAPTGSTKTITGVVHYEDRVVSDAGLSNTLTLKPARRIVVEAIRDDGSVIKMSETSNEGEYSLEVPEGVSFRIQAVAITQNLKVMNSALSIHKYASPAYLSSTIATVNLVIPCDNVQNISGAFNILDNCLSVSDLVEAATGVSHEPLQVTWQLGNSGTMVNGRLLSVSFYTQINSEHWLFIEGGVSAPQITTSTAHFDDAVIAHEFSHFIQETYSFSNSMGGSHNGDHLYYSLALGEGFATWLGAVALNNPNYIRTIGLPPYQQLNYSNYSIEGVHDISYRAYGNTSEFTVSEILWDLYDGSSTYPSDEDADGVALEFSDIFSVFTDIDRNSEYPYLSTILTKIEQRGLLSASQVTALLAAPINQKIEYPVNTEWPFAVTIGKLYEYDVDIPSGVDPHGGSAFTNQFYAFDVQTEGLYTLTVGASPFDQNPLITCYVMKNDNTILSTNEYSSYPAIQQVSLSPGKYIVRIVVERSTYYTIQLH